MFLRRIRLVLVAAAFETSDDCLACISWRDDVVDVAEFGSAVRVAELSLILLDALSLLFWSFFAVEDADSSLGSHHSDLCTLVSKVDVSTELLAVHHDVCTTVGLAGDESDLWHSSLGESIEELCTVTDDAAVLLIDARHEARDILDSHDRDIEAVAETHEASTCG